MKKIRDRIRKKILLALHKHFSKLESFDAGTVDPNPSFLARLNPMRRIADDPAGLQFLETAMTGPICFELLRTAVKVGLFDFLDKQPGATLEEIARALELDPYPVKILLLGLVPMRMIHKIEGEYFSDPIRSLILSEKTNHGFHLRTIDYAHHVINPAVCHLLESVQQNRPVGLSRLFGEEVENFYQELSENEEANRYFEPFMRTFTMLNRDRVAAMDDFSRFNRILDVGGNTGDLVMAIARRHPSVRATVFDFPPVVEETGKRFRDSGLADRLSTVGGNILESDFPSGYDCVMFSHFIDIFPEETNRIFFRKAFDCLPSGGHICVNTPVINDVETGPFINCVSSAYFLALANGQGQFYPPASVKHWLSDTGFTKVEDRTLPLYASLFFGVKP